MCDIYYKLILDYTSTEVSAKKETRKMEKLLNLFSKTMTNFMSMSVFFY